MRQFFSPVPVVNQMTLNVALDFCSVVETGAWLGQLQEAGRHSTLTNLYIIKTPPLWVDENFIFRGTLIQSQVAVTVVLPFLQPWLKHSQLHWNLWMTLETGQRNLKTDDGPPTVIVSRQSHPSCSHTAVSHGPHDSWLQGTCTLLRSEWCGITENCGKAQGGRQW